jgi:hypothetical protein
MAAKDQIRCPQCGVPNDPGALFCSRCGASQIRPGNSGKRRRRSSLAGATMALACLIALAITVFVLYTIVTRVMSPVTESNTTTSIYSGTPGTLATLGTSTTTPAITSSTQAGASTGSILIRPSAATASSSLTPTNLTDFRPTNLLDGDTATAWVEGGKGTGAGEWVKLEFEKTIKLVRIEISNGYQKDESFFSNYVRVQSIELDYSDGSRQVVELQDEQGIQVIEPNVSETGWIQLKVLSVYPDYKFPNAAVSDIRIYEALR